MGVVAFEDFPCLVQVVHDCDKYPQKASRTFCGFKD
jgi:hypothetical protein